MTLGMLERPAGGNLRLGTSSNNVEPFRCRQRIARFLRLLARQAALVTQDMGSAVGSFLVEIASGSHVHKSRMA